MMAGEKKKATKEIKSHLSTKLIPLLLSVKFEVLIVLLNVMPIRKVWSSGEKYELQNR